MAGEFDLHQLLAGPIIAMNDAQGAAAVSFYELFEQFAFEPEAEGAELAARRLRMLNFVAERATPEGIERRQISMPLLQMIPIGGVGIDTARIEFSLAINAEPATQQAQPKARMASSVEPLSARASAAPAAVALRGRIAPAAANEAATAGNLKVEIMLRQVDLPSGLLDMIAETQGGMSRRIAEPVPDAPLDPAGPLEEPEVRPLFTATMRKASARTITPGREFGFELEIVPNAERIGPAGLEIALAGEPRKAFEIIRPDTLRLDGKPRAESVLIYVTDAVAAYSPQTNVTLSVSGATVIGGATRQHRVSIVLPRKTGTAP